MGFFVVMAGNLFLCGWWVQLYKKLLRKNYYPMLHIMLHIK